MIQPQTLLLDTLLKKLRLPSVLQHYRKLALQAAENNQTYEQFLLAVFSEESRNREENTRKQRIQQAHFPARKTLDQFELTALPSLNKAFVLNLAQGEYTDKAENIVMLGNSGTGKHTLQLLWEWKPVRKVKKSLFIPPLVWSISCWNPNLNIVSAGLNTS